MSNPPPPVKVSPNPTGRAAVTEPELPTPQFPGLSTIPSTPSYNFPNPQSPKLRIVSATFKYGEQSINIIKYLKANMWSGYVEYPVKTLFNDLKTDGIILPLTDPDSIKLKPPVASVQWFDESGYHTMNFAMDATIILGKLTVWGLFMKKPGELSWTAALAAGRIQFWLAVGVFWILMVMWAYKMWGHMMNAGLNWRTATAGRFGEYGQWFAMVAGVIAPYGVTKYIMAFIAALAPVWSFCIQFAMWFFVDSQLPERGTLPDSSGPVAASTTPSISELLAMRKK